jgi:hypothetical protein
MIDVSDRWLTAHGGPGACTARSLGAGQSMDHVLQQVARGRGNYRPLALLVGMPFLWREHYGVGPNWMFPNRTSMIKPVKIPTQANILAASAIRRLL